MKHLILLVAASLVLTACEKIGSDAWCDKMGDKPKDSWTIEETKQYGQYCVLGMDPEKWCDDMDEKPKGEWTAKEAERYAKQCIGG